MTYYLLLLHLLHLLVVLSSSQPFTHIQTLNDSTPNSVISLSAQSNLLVLAQGQTKLIYANVGFAFSPYELWNYEFNIPAVDVTSDGSWFTVATTGYQNGIYVGGVVVFHHLPLADRFEHFDPHNIGFYTSNAVAISDDHLWVISGHSNGIVHVYFFDGNSYLSTQVLQPRNESVGSVSLTSDHEYLVVSYESDTLIYQHIGDFSLIQTLAFNSSATRQVQLTDDHQTLLITHQQEGFVELYQFDNGTFVPFLSTGSLLVEEGINEASICDDGQLLGVAANNQTYIFSIRNHSLVDVQRLNISSNHLTLSSDGRYLLSAEDNQVSIFFNQAH